MELNNRLKSWMKETKTTRAEVAKALGISPRTVEGWLSPSVNRHIPFKKMKAVEQLIAPTNMPGHIAVQVTFTDEEWEELTKGLPDYVDKVAFVRSKMLALIEAAKWPN